MCVGGSESADPPDLVCCLPVPILTASVVVGCCVVCCVDIVVSTCTQRLYA